MRERCDVLVVGAGPAGSATAARLAARGHDVLLLDRADFPRRKACGECVNPAAVEALERLGALPAVHAARPAPLIGWRLRGLGGAGFEGRFGGGARGFALPRAVLDMVLLEHARSRGARVRLGVRVVDLLRDDAGAIVGARLREADSGRCVQVEAVLVVGADGLRSVVARRLGAVVRPPRLRKLALSAHVAGVRLPRGFGELRVGDGECLGLADVGGGTANVTLVLTGGHAAAARGDAAGCFDRALARAGLERARRVDAVLATGPFDVPVRSVVADGALLVGDAAGYYDPFTGQGIFRALRGAELAAEAADVALRAGSTGAAALAPYAAEHRRAFASGERVQKLIEAVVSRPRLFALAARRLARRPALADALVRVTGDVAPAAALLHPRLLAGLLG